MSFIELSLAGVATGASVLAWWYRSRLISERLRHETALSTEREQRAVELHAQAARTAALLDRMVEGIIVTGVNGRIRLANHAAGNLFGFAPPATGRTVIEATRQHEVAALASRLEAQPEILNHEIRLDGISSTRFLQVNALSLRDPSDRPDGGILVFHDLTRIRELEAVRQEFVANVSHELRTPLSLIKSAVETLIDGARHDSAATGRFLDIIDRHASRLTYLIDDLLLLSRLDSGRVALELQPVSLRELVQESLNDAALLARSKGVTLTNEVPHPLTIMADPQRLRQVLSNLIDNAIKYGRADGHVGIQARNAPGAVVEVCVRDDGPGIPPEARERVFERFYRVDKARSREQGGTGLGLSIVKNVIQAHGGDVRVESMIGHGAAFYFTLPAQSYGPSPGSPDASQDHDRADRETPPSAATSNFTLPT